MKRWKVSGERGFTVVELMIATVVFSVVLLVITFGIIQISRTYYKGVTENNTQNTARSIMDTVTQAIQLNGGAVTDTPAAPVPANGGSQAFCVGNQQFSYRLGWQLKDGAVNATNHETPRALVLRDNVANCAGAPAQNLSGGGVTGRELLAPHMRLAALDVENITGTNTYRVSIKVVYGDWDILDDELRPEAKCRGIRAGTQFCAVADLSTVVTKRVK